MAGKPKPPLKKITPTYARRALADIHLLYEETALSVEARPG